MCRTQPHLNAFVPMGPEGPQNSFDYAVINQGTLNLPMSLASRPAGVPDVCISMGGPKPEAETQ